MTHPVNPDIYRILTYGLQWDIAHYQELAVQYGSPILELGVGLGRIALELVKEGHQVLGVDIASNMCLELEHAKSHLAHDCQNLLSIHCADMTTFSLSQRFALALLPLRSLHLLKPTDQLEVLHRVYEHLLPSGILVIHLSHFQKNQADSIWRFTREVPTTNGLIQIDEMLRYHAPEDCFQLRHRLFQYNDQDQQIASWKASHDLYPISQADALQLLAETGFDIVEERPLMGNDLLLVAKKLP